MLRFTRRARHVPESEGMGHQHQSSSTTGRRIPRLALALSLALVGASVGGRQGAASLVIGENSISLQVCDAPTNWCYSVSATYRVIDAETSDAPVPPAGPPSQRSPWLRRSRRLRA